MDPLELLPAEVWQMIFEKVEDPQDWLDLYRASSSTFEGVVGEERVRVLLPQVLPLVRKHLDEDLNQILPLRLVSKHWKKVVDTALQPQEDEFGAKNVNFQEIEHKYRFWNPDSIYEFLEKFGTHPGNPFVGNCVRFDFSPFMPGEMAVEYRRSVQRLMERFGNQIRKLCIYGIIGTSPSLDDFVHQLRRCVGLAPNLEELTVWFTHGGNAAFQLGDLANRPLPIISKLKSFSFYGNGEPELLVGLQNILVRLCCNPDTLKTCKVLGVPMELTTFPNLETATVEVTRVDEDFRHIMNSAWQLTQLTLRRREDAPPISLDAGITECVEHFKETLTSLWIDDGLVWAPPEPSLELRLDLPKLKYLVMGHHLLPRRILGNLPGLERIRIFDHFVPSDVEYIQELLEFIETQFTENKVWEALPKLRKIEVIGWHPFSFVTKSVRKVYYREKATSFKLGD